MPRLISVHRLPEGNAGSELCLSVIVKIRPLLNAISRWNLRRRMSIMRSYKLWYCREFDLYKLNKALNCCNFQGSCQSLNMFRYEPSFTLFHGSGRTGSMDLTKRWARNLKLIITRPETRCVICIRVITLTAHRYKYLVAFVVEASIESCIAGASSPRAK